MPHFFQKLYSLISTRSALLIERARMTEHTFMIVIALIIGICGGYGAVAIRAMIKIISDLSFPGNDNLLVNIIAAPIYIKILIKVNLGEIKNC